MARTQVQVRRDSYSAALVRRHNTHHSLIPQKSCTICRRYGVAWIVTPL